MKTDTRYRFRVSDRMLTHLESSSLMQQPMAEHGYDEHGEEVKAAVNAAKRRKDGSITVELGRQAAWVLWDLADDLAQSSRDDIGDPWSGNSALADFNTGSRLARTIEDTIERSER